MWKIVSFLGIIILIAVALTFYKNSSKKVEIPKETLTQPTNTASKPEVSETSPMEVIAKNLEVPWALAFLPASPAGGPDKSILVTERVGRVRIINNEGILQEKPLITVPVKQSGESGLHGIAIHPNFTENHYVYLYYTYSANGNNTFNRVSRFTLSGDSLTDEKIIVDKIPGAIFHDGGRIKFGPDGQLYITTGDALNPSLAQDKNSLAGKILRVNDEGKLAPDNPFNNLIFSYGHRNPQGITWDNLGRLWSTEHGASATDEINLIEPGKNYGWPVITGDQNRQGMVSPILQSAQQTWAPAGAAYYEGSIFFAGLRGKALFQLELDALKLKEHFTNQFGRIRDVVLGSDNMLYITTSNRDGRGNPAADDDKIIRINPDKL